MMFILILFLLALPFLEIYLLFKVGVALGAVKTLALLLLGLLVGSRIARRQGSTLLAQWRNHFQRGELPSDRLLEGGLVFFGGILFAIPGFITDVIAVFFVTPGLRKICALALKRHLARKIQKGEIRFYSSRGAYSSRGFRYAKDIDVKDISVTSVRDLPPPPPPRSSGLNEGSIHEN